MILIDKQNRKALSEGRNSGIGFGFGKRDGDTVTTVMPVSCCKDFLSDQVYSEATGKPYSAHGFNSKKQDLFTGPMAYMALGILPQNNGTYQRKDHKNLEAALMSPETGLESFLSHFEEKFGVTPTKFEKVAENRMVAVFSTWWCMATYRISLWSLLVRVGLKFKEGDPMAFLAKVSDDDAYMVKAAIPKIERLAKGDHPIQDFTRNISWHNEGIVAFQFDNK